MVEGLTKDEIERMSVPELKRRLKELRLKAALSGSLTDPVITIAIQDIEAELKKWAKLRNDVNSW